MTDFGCPFGACPQCGDCDGLCWEQPASEAWLASGPQPCEGCYYVTGHMQACDGTCDGLTAENLDERRRAFAATAEGGEP